MKKTELYFDSANGKDRVQYFIFEPDMEPKAVIRFVHGMAEHVERYEEYFTYLADKGFLVSADNHIGHKGSVASDDDLGYFADHDGWKYLVEDEKKLTDLMREKYPHLPVFLYGHSMGSFIARAYLTRYADTLSGAIICGSAGSNPMLGMGKKMAAFLRKIKGARHRSGLMTMIMFGSYNKKYKDPKSAYAWLTRDEQVVCAYEADPYCGFMFTISGYQDLMELLDRVNADSWYESVPVELPILVVSGSMDPVGGWSEGIYEIDQKLRRKQRNDVTVKLYKDMRHEIHNEIGKEGVWTDIANWVEERL